MADGTDAVFKAALEYAAMGWQVIPIAPGKKHPNIEEWQKKATNDEDAVISLFERRVGWGVGVKLGKDSKLIDIECDSDDGERIWAGICNGQEPYTATYIGKRGKHRLFRWTDDLPNPNLAFWHIGDLEFRTGNGEKGAQSVMPPSMHPDGMQYKWIIPPHESGIAELTPEMIARIWNSGGEDIFSGGDKKQPSVRLQLYTQEVIPEGQRDNTIYAEACEEWRKEVAANGHRAFDDPSTQAHVYERLWVWNQVKCKPPLTDQEIHAKVESAKKFIQSQQFDKKNEINRASLSMHGLEWRDDEWWPGAWQMTVILSKPPLYLLKVPAWNDLLLDEETIELSSEVYRSADAVAQAIFAATKTVIVDDRPGGWQAIWNGSAGNKKEQKAPIRGLKAKLLDNAKTIEAPPQWKRPAVVAEILAEKIGNAREQDKPDHRGKPIRMPDGTIWIRWSKLWEEEIALRRVTAQEVQQLSRAIGITSKDSRRYPNNAKAERLSYFVLTESHLRRINEIRDYGEPPPPAAQTSPSHTAVAGH